MDPDSDWRDYLIHILGVVIFAVFLIALLALCSSCQTVEAVTSAPEEFWITLETILWALWGDVLTVVDLVL